MENLVPGPGQHAWSSAFLAMGGGLEQRSAAQAQAPSVGVAGSGAVAKLAQQQQQQQQQQNVGLKRAASSHAQQGADSSRPRTAFADITNHAVGRLAAEDALAKASKPALGAAPQQQQHQPLQQLLPPALHSNAQPSAFHHLLPLPLQSQQSQLQFGHSEQENRPPSQQQQQQPPPLAQQAFCDPTLIDHGLQHADKRRRDWIDVDALNEEDTQACSAYAVAIFEHLREAELHRRPNALYPEQYQADVNAKMRAILVDWLVEVAEEYKLCADTLYLSVNYIDRFLSIHPVQRSNLQLVGITCMWIASKYEEIYPPNVNDFCYITDNTYSKEQMVAMEELILKKLKYELTVPTSKTFLRRLLQVCNPDEYLHFLSNYLAEASLLDNSMMGFLPSQVAAASVYLANLMLQRPPWDGSLQHYSTYSPRDISMCVQALVTLHQSLMENAQLAAIREKYAHPRFQSVSRIPIAGVSLATATVGGL